MNNWEPVTSGVQDQPLHMLLQIIAGVDDGVGQS